MQNDGALLASLITQLKRAEGQTELKTDGQRKVRAAFNHHDPHPHCITAAPPNKTIDQKFGPEQDLSG